MTTTTPTFISDSTGLTDSPVLLVDAHAHLADLRLRQRLDAICAELPPRHVSRVLVNAALPEEWAAVIELSRKPGIYGALGIHPFFPDRWTPLLADNLRNAIHTAPKDAKIAAIGEIGLDAWNGRDTLPVQLEMLAAQLKLALELGLPVALHNRKTWADFFHLLKSLKITKLRGYCHHFTGSPDVLKSVLALGLKVSYCGPAAHPDAHKIHRAILATPFDALLTETDCPDLPPVQAQAEESMPWHTEHVLRKIAELKQCRADNLARQIQHNFDSLFLD